MKISVIVPYWNCEKWLRRCLESLKMQEGDFEFILVNDKSTDGSDDVAEEFAMADERFALAENKHSKGVSGARNTGLELATGEWITFIDADDEMLEDAHKNYERAIGKGKGNIYQLNHYRYYAKTDRLVMKYSNPAGDFTLPALPEAWFGVWNKIYKAEFIKKIRFEEKLRFGEDGLFVLECLAKDPVIHHAGKNITTIKHRFDNPNSITHNKTAEDLLKQIRYYEKFLLKQKDPVLRQTVCRELSIIWAHSRTLKIIGLREE